MRVQYKAYSSRWWILGVFSFVSFTQCAIWLTYSPVAASSKKFYGLCHTESECQDEKGPGQADIDLFLNWGPIIYIFTVFPVMKFSRRENSLKTIVQASVALELCCCALRAIPTLFFDAGHPQPWVVPMVHFAQILNAAVGPLSMATPTLLASLWFPEKERSTATAIAILSNNLGMFGGFVAPWVVNGDAANMPYVLWIHLGFTTVVFLVVAAYFPGKPPTPPSASGDRDLEQSNFIQEVAEACRSVDFLLLSIGAGVVAGIYNAWSGSLDTILPHSVVTTKQIGSLSIVSSGAYCLGELLIGPFMDRVPFFKRRYKFLLFILLFFSALTFLLFTLLLPSPFSKEPVLESSLMSLVLAISLCSLLLGSVNPLVYSMGVEVSFPVSEGTSAGFISFFNNVGCVVLLFAKGSIPVNAITFIMTSTIVGTMLCLTFVKESYKRMDYDDEMAKCHRDGRSDPEIGYDALLGDAINDK